jgi:hypothetical protein
MTDQEFRALCEKWIETYLASIEASRQYGSLSAQLELTPMPRAVESLAVALDAHRRMEDTRELCQAAYARSRALSAQAAELDARIRATLPADVWYRVNGKGIRHQMGVATQIVDWEEVLEKVAQ